MADKGKMKKQAEKKNNKQEMCIFYNFFMLDNCSKT